MNSADVITSLLGAARSRRLAIALALGLPLALAAAVLAAQLSLAVAAMVLLVGIGATAVAAWLRIRTQDRNWLVHRLDSQWPAMEDSTSLVAHDAGALRELQMLQRGRIAQRLQHELVPDIRDAWPLRMIALSVGTLLIALLTILWFANAPTSSLLGAPSGTTATGAQIKLRDARIDIVPPAYTALPERREVALDVHVPESSVLTWTLRFDRKPGRANLEFHDGAQLSLHAQGDDWTGQRKLNVPALYRIVLEGSAPLADRGLHGIDVIGDAAPMIRVSTPQHSLTLLDDDALSQLITFDVRDDYGIADVHLAITLAQGDGESIRFSERTVVLQPETPTDSRQQHYRHQLDLQALGIAPGDDIVVRVIASDHREPVVNTTRSAAYILRWPQQRSAYGASIDGIMQTTLPAYFRSQRQIIIDSEALIAASATMDDAVFMARADALGVDQKILRLRYGEFLGEEFETHAGPQAPEDSEPSGLDHDDPDETDSDSPAAYETPAAERVPDHDHDSGNRQSAVFGSEADVVAEYGHTHDHAEAATLLDKPTKAILRVALDNMWQSELHLRMGKPAKALPFQHLALEAIKQVQQSTRIYLARVGLELPVVDETRRLSGDRATLSDRNAPLSDAAAGNAVITHAWQQLAEPAEPDWDALTRWLDSNQSDIPDALGIIAALDHARREPDCVECRESLHGHLWPLLAAPATNVVLRPRPDAAGNTYLDAIPAGGSQ